MYKITLYENTLGSCLARRLEALFPYMYSIILLRGPRHFPIATHVTPSWWMAAVGEYEYFRLHYSEADELAFMEHYQRGGMSSLRMALRCLDAYKAAADVTDVDLIVEFAKILSPEVNLEHIQIHGHTSNEVADIIFDCEKVTSEDIAIFEALYFNLMTDVYVEDYATPEFVINGTYWQVLFNFQIPDKSNPDYETILKRQLNIPEWAEVQIQHTSNSPSHIVRSAEHIGRNHLNYLI